MKFLSYLFVAVTLYVVVAGSDARADQLRIEISGVYTKDPKFGESFGSLEAALPISVSLVINESQGLYLPKGTPLMTGQPIAEDGLIIPASGVISLSAEVGDLRWNESDLSPLPESDAGIRPAVILMGDLQSDSVKIYCSVARAHEGALSLTHLVCDGSGCTLDNGAWGHDIRTGSHGKLSDLSASINRSNVNLGKAEGRSGDIGDLLIYGSQALIHEINPEIDDNSDPKE